MIKLVFFPRCFTAPIYWEIAARIEKKSLSSVFSSNMSVGRHSGKLRYIVVFKWWCISGPIFTMSELED
jgi:hypothetical protein